MMLFFCQNFPSKTSSPNHASSQQNSTSSRHVSHHHLPGGQSRPNSRLSADWKRKFFQRRCATSAPNSSNESSLESSTNLLSFPKFTHHQLRKENSDSAVSRALEEAFRTTTILSGWEQPPHRFPTLMS